MVKKNVLVIPILSKFIGNLLNSIIHKNIKFYSDNTYYRTSFQLDYEKDLEAFHQVFLSVNILIKDSHRKVITSFDGRTKYPKDITLETLQNIGKKYAMDAIDEEFKNYSG